jgi:alpha-methylacyl-CoA racemase
VMKPLPLSNIQVINLSVNLPGPSAAARLAQLGASVTKIEPPSGDPLALWFPEWYHFLTNGQQVIQLNLKLSDDLKQLEEKLAEADLLLTSMRLSALHRLSLDWETLSGRFPQLCQVAIVGYPPPDDERAGHDLIYQAGLGLVDPPTIPRTLLADLAGAERAVYTALALLLGRQRGQGSGFAVVSLVEAAELFAQPLQYGATAPGGLLGGGLPRYRLYRAQQGWIAVAALEEHFWQRLTMELGLVPAEAQAEDLQSVFLTEPASYWDDWARERDIPLLAIQDRG